VNWDADKHNLLENRGAEPTRLVPALIVILCQTEEGVNIIPLRVTGAGGSVKGNHYYNLLISDWHQQAVLSFFVKVWNSKATAESNSCLLY